VGQITIFGVFMLLKLRLLPLAAVAILLAACGGGSSPSFVGPVYTVTDGHVKGAKAVCKVNPNSDSEASPNFSATGLSDANGQFRFSQACNAEVVASGGTNPDGLPLIGLLRAPVNATVLTPLTTLMTGPTPMTEAQIIQALDLPPSTKLLTTDPASGSQLVLQAKTLAVHQLALQVTNTLAKLGGVDVSSTASAADVAKLQPIYDIVKDSVVQSVKAAVQSGIPLITVTGVTSTVNPAVVQNMVAVAAAAVSLADSNIQAGVAKVGPTNLAAATTQALVTQANALLAAPTPVALTTVTSNMQGNTGIPDTIAAAVLGTTPTLTTATVPTAITTIANAVNSVAATTTTSTTTSTTVVGATTTTTTASSSSTSSTSSTSTTSTTTTTTVPVVTVNYLYLTDNSISYTPYTGATPTTYTLADFKSAAGMIVNWPMADSAAIDFKLGPNGRFNGTVSAAFAITDTTVGGRAAIKGYIDNVNVTSNANGVTVTVPGTATARVYAMDANGSEIMGSFTDTVTGVNNTMTYSNVSQITLGSVMQVAMTRLGGLSNLSGKFRVTLVVPGLMLAQSDGSALTSYTVDVPVANGALKSFTGHGIEGYMTLVNPSVTTTTSTTSTTTTSTTTSSTLPSPNNYLSFANDSLSLYDGSSSTSYTLTQFQSSPGIAVKWPMANTAAIGFTLTDGGTFSVGTGQTYRAALEIVDTAPSGLALVQAYIDSVTITKNGTAVTLTVPASVFARVYARGSDGSEVLSGFADTVAGVTNTLTTGATGNIVLGNVVNNAMTRLGNVTGLTGKTYKVTLVVPNSPLRQTGGTAFTNASVTVPGSLASGAAPVTVTGPSLTGFINLTP